MRRLNLVIPAAGVLLMLFALVLPPERSLAKRGWKFAERVSMIVSGHLVDVGGRRLHISCSGSGAPAVVLDSGLNMTMKTWGVVPSEVAQFARVCMYERAGVGESDPAPVPRTFQQLTTDLYTLLRNAGVPGPYVLVGHSVGGLNVRLFASEHPEEVAGIILVDASNENEYYRIADLMPADEREKYLRHEGGENHERVDLLASAEQIKHSSSLPKVPLVVLTAMQNGVSPDEGKMKLHLELQSELARLSSSSQQTLVKDSNHFIQLQRPNVVIDAIRSVVGAARSRP
jgi:pimeloyl-ACP methyl ester carboxylesterase